MINFNWLFNKNIYRYKLYHFDREDQNKLLYLIVQYDFILISFVMSPLLIAKQVSKQLRYLYLSVVLLVSFLEVEAQQLPEGFDYSVYHLRIPTQHVGADFKILKGNILEEAQRQHTAGIIGLLNRGNAHTTFKPLVPFDLESPYTLVYNQQVFFFEIEREATEVPLTVTEIYPSVRHVPANILKWYIKFSKPVNPVKIYEHIQFRDGDGNPIDRSILHLGTPLLSADGTLLTIWIEPGRQKRLLGPNEHLGSVFEQDHEYALHISNTLKDAKGLPIETAINHSFATTEPDRVKPSTALWRIGSIRANTIEPLMIVCNEQMDYGSLLDAVSVHYKGTTLEGQFNYNSELNEISFTPKHKWRKGTYSIKVGYQLEDLAGNNLVYLFDRPLAEEQDSKLEDIQTITIICD